MFSNRPEMIQDRWLDGAEEIARLAKKVDVSVCGLLESPAVIMHKAIVDVIPKARVEVKKAGKGVFNFCEWREDVCRMDEKADLFLMTDDDMRFVSVTNSGYNWHSRVFDCIKYMTKHDKCGFICMKNFLGGSPSGKRVMEFWEKPIYEHGAGLLLRNMHHRNFIYSKKELARPGALDETAACYSRIEEGYFPAKTFNVPTAKLASKRINGENVPDYYKASYLNKQDIAGAIRSRYEDPEWDYNQRRLPPKLIEMYKDAG